MVEEAEKGSGAVAVGGGTGTDWVSRTTDQKTEGWIPLPGSSADSDGERAPPLPPGHHWALVPGPTFQRELSLCRGLRWSWGAVCSALHTEAQGLGVQPPLTPTQGFLVPGLVQRSSFHPCHHLFTQGSSLPNCTHEEMEAQRG